MEKQKATNLSTFDNSWYQPGRGRLVQACWYVLNSTLLKSGIPGSFWRRALLRIFGAQIGKKVVLKPRIHIKYPWKLRIGDYTWIGEYVWIDNLEIVNIGKHCCVSQGAMLLCGNHNYKSPSFDLITQKIQLEDGVWIGAKALVAPGVICSSHSILTAGSIATKNLDAYGIYSGNPAIKVRERAFE